MRRNDFEKQAQEGVAGSVQVLPRFIRFRDAPGYLGMDRNKFNKLVRPTLYRRYST